MEPDPQPRVDPEHPWPALLSFREDDQRYFGGRKEEVEALYRRIVSSRLTLLFGLSGLGKSSLLRAGLFPRLRSEHYFPVYIRLRYGRDLPPPIEQIKTEIVAQARAARIEAPEPRDGETLWQYFHRPDADFWDERNYPSTPVLVFDQFEELFTKSREVAEHANEVIEELANLAEGASPALLRDAATRDPTLLKSVFEDRYRLLIGVRSDYLAQLQGISDRVRAIFANRYELHRMSGAAALESTLTAGGLLLDEDVARRIVRFVAGAKESGDTQSVEGLEVEPALLSLVCSELNTTRLENDEPKITASMLSGTKDEILSRFYEASFADVSPELRVLVEDKLVTRDGKARNFISEQTARETAGVSDEDIAKLVHRRLLRFEESGSSRRMELTHDLLTAVAAASRSTREQRRQLEESERARSEAEQREASARRKLRRSRAAMVIFLILLAAAVAGPFIAARWTATGAKKVEADSAFRLALQTLTSEEPAEGLSYLARVIRLDRGNSIARTLLYEQLTTRAWPVPIRSFGPQARIADAAFSADGARVALRVGQTIEMWDVAKGKPIGRIDAGFEPYKIEIASDGRTVLFSSGAYSSGPIHPMLWNSSTGRSMSREDIGNLPSLRDCNRTYLQAFDVSPNGEEIFVGCPGLRIAPLRGEGPAEKLGSAIYDTYRNCRFTPDPRLVLAGERTIFERQGAGAAPVQHELEGPLVGMSGDGKRIAIERDEASIEIWDTNRWEIIGKFQNQYGDVSVTFDRTGHNLITRASDDQIRLWTENGDRFQGFDTIWLPDVRVAGFSGDGQRIFTASDRRAVWWSASNGDALGAPIVQPKMLPAHLDDRGDIVTVSRGVRAWQLATAVPPSVTADFVLALGLSADRKTFLGEDEEGTQMAYDATSGKRRWSLPKGLDIHSFDREMSRLIVTKGAAISLVDTKTWRQYWTLPESQALFATFSGDGTVVVTGETGDRNTTFVVRSAETGKPLAPPIDAMNRTLVKVSRDGMRLALRSDKTLEIRDVRQSHRATVAIAADVKIDFSPDGRWLATVSPREGVQVWDTAAGRARRVTIEDGETPVEAKFSPDGRLLAVRSGNAVALCDAETLDCASVLAHRDVHGLDFSADGQRVLTTDLETWRVWDVTTGLPLSLGHRGSPPLGLSADGTSVLFAIDNVLHRVALPSIDDDADAGRLASLGEALAGVRIDRLGVTEPVDGTKALAELENECRDVRGSACDLVRSFTSKRLK